MRAGTDTAMARVVAVFGAQKPHCAYLSADRRANRMNVFVQEWRAHLACRTPSKPRKFHWPGIHRSQQLELGTEQIHAAVLGLPSHRVGASGVVTQSF